MAEEAYCAAVGRSRASSLKRLHATFSRCTASAYSAGISRTLRTNSQFSSGCRRGRTTSVCSAVEETKSVDFGSLRIDTPLTDLARLIGTAAICLGGVALAWGGIGLVAATESRRPSG